MRMVRQPWAAWTLLVLAGWTLIRLVWINAFEVAGDEAYYWLWSKHLDWNYYSKGPGVAWTMALSTGLLGDTAFGIRLPSVLLAAGTGWGLFLLGRDLVSPRTGFWTVVIASLFPLFAVGGLLMTIDPLSVFFWTWTLWLGWRLRDATSPWVWLGPGLLIGIGAMCKYTNLALLPSFGLFVLLRDRPPASLRIRSFAVLAAASLLPLLPSVAWMANHDWITLVHLRERGALDEPFRIRPGQWLEFLGLQTVMVFPLLFLAFGYVLLRHRDLYRTEPGRFLLAAFAPLFLFYTVLAANDAGQPNWTAPAWVAGTVILAWGWLTLRDTRPLLRRLERPVAACAGLVIVLLHVLLLVPVPDGEGQDAFRRVRGARGLAGEVDALRKAHGVEFLIGNHYQIAAHLAFYGDGHPPVYTLDDDRVRNQFDVWPGYLSLPDGSDALFVGREDRVPPLLHAQFRAVEPLAVINPTFRGAPVTRYHVFLCRGLRSDPDDGGDV